MHQTGVHPAVQVEPEFHPQTFPSYDAGLLHEHDEESGGCGCESLFQRVLYRHRPAGWHHPDLLVVAASLPRFRLPTVRFVPAPEVPGLSLLRFQETGLQSLLLQFQPE